MSIAARKYAPPHVLRPPKAFLDPKTERPGTYPNWDEAVGMLIRMLPFYLRDDEVESEQAETARSALGMMDVPVDRHEAIHCLRLILSNQDEAEALIRSAGELLRIVLTDFLVAGTATQKAEGHYPPPE